SEKAQRTMDVNELDKKFRDSAFGATELGSFIREQTTGRAVHAKFGGEKSVHEGYEESEKLFSRRFAIENMQNAKNTADQVEGARGRLLAEKPKWQDKKYKNDDGSFNQAKFHVDFEKWMNSFKPVAENYAPNRYAKEYRNPDGTFNQAEFDKDTKEGKVQTNKKYKNADGSFNQALYNTDVLAGQAEFTKDLSLFESTLKRQPHRAIHAAGPAGDATFAAEQKKFEEYFEKPDRTSISYASSKRITDNRNKIKDQKANEVKKLEGSLGSFINQIVPDEFARMSEKDIMKMAKFANLKQIKAVMASEHWAQQEKKHMLAFRWSTEVKGFEEFSQNVMEPYRQAVRDLEDAIREKELDVDKTGKVQDKRDDGKTDQVIIDPADGKKYALLKSGGRVLIPEPPSVPSELKGWARNKMTKEEYEVASLVMPTLFDNPDLVHVIRWNLTNKEFRTDENMDYGLRDRMTYTKDSDLDIIVMESNPNYIAEDSAETRGKAFIAAEAAVAAEKKKGITDPEILKNVFQRTYRRLTANDTNRHNRAVNWADGRAPNEISGARGRNRNSKAVHRLVDAGVAQNYKDKDSEDMRVLLEDVLTDYKAERDGKGVVSQQNRDLIRYLFTDKNSKNLTRPTANLSPELQTLYAELMSTGNYDPAQAKNIKYRSDG
ncbi:MAG: hypothetical protein NUV54_03280, partial [Candidatus Taylorbacteria bacterium]|nr:hypothetical protein [Candidatus Taylorbacteria bacterium]